MKWSVIKEPYGNECLVLLHRYEGSAAYLYPKGEEWETQCWKKGSMQLYLKPWEVSSALQIAPKGWYGDSPICVGPMG